MDHIQKVRTYLELNSSVENPKSVRAIAESLTMPEEEVGLAVHQLIKEDVIRTGPGGNSEGLHYYLEK